MPYDYTKYHKLISLNNLKVEIVEKIRYNNTIILIVRYRSVHKKYFGGEGLVVHIRTWYTYIYLIMFIQ